MGIATLFVDVHIVDSNGGIIGPGYVRVSDGVISHIGVGEPPEEAQLAELVLGGHGRLLYPGFGAVTVYPETYILRDYIDGDGLPDKSILECIREMNEEEAYYSSLMAFYEMSLAGYTRVIALSPHAGAVARALKEAGLVGAVLALVENASELKDSPRLEQDAGSQIVLGVAVTKPMLSEIPVGGIKCTIENKCSIRCDNWLIVPFGCKGEGIVAPVYPFVTPSQIMRKYRAQGLLSLVRDAHRVVNRDYIPLDKGVRAHIAVYDVSEPPSWMGPLELASPYMLTPLARVETLVSEGRLVIDGSEHLFLGPEASEKAMEVLGDVRNRCNKRLGRAW